MSKEDHEAWSWVTVNLAVWEYVPDEVVEALREWFGRKYPKTDPSSRSTGWAIVERQEEGYTWLSFDINRRYNAHIVGKIAEKKLSKLLAARRA